MTRETDADGVRLQRIQEVAAEVGLTARSIRYYEEVGLLAPAGRSEGAYRLYDADDLARLRFIKGLRDDAGFSLADVVIQIEDDGRGVDEDGPSADGANGLLGMRERAAALGGELEAGPHAAGGFRVWARLPLDGAA